MKTEKHISVALRSGLVLFAMAMSAIAAPILVEWQDGTAGHLFEDWNTDAVSRPEDGSVVPPVGVGTLDLAMGGGGAGVVVDGETALSVTGARTGGDDLFYTTAFGTVDLTQFAGISFDFYADDTDSLVDFGVYFQSVDNSVWFYSINPSLVTAGTWENFGASLTYSDAWYGLSVSGGFYDEITVDIGDAFDDALLAGADQLGFYITHVPGPGGGQVYGIDDFGLTVPEPETYVVLGMALLSVAFIFRKRITVSLAEARAMMQM